MIAIEEFSELTEKRDEPRIPAALYGTALAAENPGSLFAFCGLAFHRPSPYFSAG